MNTNKFNFAFALPTYNQDPKNNYKNDFFTQLQEEYPFLRIIGLERDVNATNTAGVGYARPGSIIEFNSSENYDVDWFATPVDAMLDGLNTDLDLKKDWNEIWEMVDDYVEANYPIDYYTTRRINGLNRPIDNTTKDKVSKITIQGKKVDVTDAFVKVGNTIIPRIINEKKPVTLRKDARRIAKDLINGMIVVIK